MDTDISVKYLGLFTPNYKLLQSIDKKFTNTLFSYVDQVEGFLTYGQTALLNTIYYNKYGKLVEVGSYKGRSAICALMSLQGNKYEFYCVDHFTGSKEHKEELQGQSTLNEFRSNLRKFGFLNDVIIQDGNSLEISGLHIDNSLSSVFIDASHDYDSVVSDINCWYPKLKPGGIMFGHDYPHPDLENIGFEDLRRAVDEQVKESYRFKHFGFFWGIWGAIKK